MRAFHDNSTSALAYLTEGQSDRGAAVLFNCEQDGRSATALSLREATPGAIPNRHLERNNTVIQSLMKDEVISYDIASCDATTLQVLKEPHRAAETKSYVYCMRGGSPGKEVVLYDYNEAEHNLLLVNQ